MEIIGYLASILIGVSLGFIGGGGSILTVPVLVYLFAVDTVLATTYSLFVVGTTSLVGSISFFRKGLVHLKIVCYFGIPSIAAVFLTRNFILPTIPEKIMGLGSFTFTKPTLLMVLFAILMIFASYSMIKNVVKDRSQNKQMPILAVTMQGLVTGLVTGMIGAGGGFLIIPALVNFLRLPIKMAIGTSLLIVALNSLAGFGFSIGQNPIQWSFLLSVTFTAIVGVFIGSYLSTQIDGEKLKPAFGWFVLVMGIYILVKETILR